MIKVQKGTSTEDVLEALRIMELLGPAKERTEGGASQGEEPDAHKLLVQRLKETRFRKKPRKLHWKTKLAKRRAKGRKDNQVIRARRKEQWIERLSDPNDAKAWYDWLARKSNTGWAQRKGWEITFSDFEEYVWPKLKGRVPVTYRINTKRNWSLDNVRWYDSETKSLLADGSELYMLKRGYILPEDGIPEEGPELVELSGE